MPKKRNISRKLLSVFYVFCEGEKTEPNYLDAYVKEHCPTYLNGKHGRFRLDERWRVSKKKCTDPNSLVNLAVKQREKSPRGSGDQFWCVYDREPESGIREFVHLKALRTAHENDIHVAISNVCFEVWLLLHKQNECAPYNSCEDLLKRSKLKKHMGGYEKGMNFSFTDAEISDARKRAMKMAARETVPREGVLPRALEPAQILRVNPSTNMHCLLDAIDAFFLGEY